VHHRVKNNLQIITSLLTLQAGRVSEPWAREVLGQTRSRISALALIYRLLYQDDSENERGEVALDSLMSELCIQLRAANRDRPGVELQCDTLPHPIAIDHAVPLALFVVEAVTNAYRHAFAPEDKGHIQLKVDHVGPEDILEISDNGRGFLQRADLGQMGSELMNAFATQVSGVLETQSKVGKGTTIRLRLPSTAKS
jgi:two-component sensor histidine kinase